MLSHCRPPPTVGEFFAGHPHWQTLWSLDSTAETVTVTNRQRREKKNSGKIPVHFVGARGARARFTDGVREHHRRRTHPGAARTTRERGRAGAWASGRAASRVRIRQRPLQGQLHTHTYRHRRLWDWIDYLSIFRVKNEVSVAKIASIILSIFRVKTIDYRFRFLE